MKQNVEFDPQLEKQLAALRSIPARDPQMAARGRAAFLAQASQIRPSVPATQPSRLNGWISALTTPFIIKKKESHMFSVITTIILVLSVLFGGSGITLAAAQTSLPDEPLYALKLWTENTRYSLAGDEESKVQLLLTFAAQRMEEYMAFSEKASEKAAETGTLNFEYVAPKMLMLQARYFGVVDQALRLATGKTTETEVLAALDVISDTLQAHIQKLDRDRVNDNNKAPETDPVSNFATEYQLRNRFERGLANRFAWAHGVTTGEVEVQVLVDALVVQAAKQQAQGQQQVPQGEQTGNATQTSQGPFGVPFIEDDTLPSYGPGPGEPGPNFVEECDVDGVCIKIPFGTKTPGAGYGPGLQPTYDPSRGPYDGTQPGPGSQTSPSPKKP